jgi:hypothetical protein
MVKLVFADGTTIWLEGELPSEPVVGGKLTLEFESGTTLITVLPEVLVTVEEVD